MTYESCPGEAFITRQVNLLCLSFFGAVDQERAFGFERAKLGRVAEPPAGVNLRRSRMVSDSFGLHISETGSAKPFAPFRCGEQVCFDREQTAPLMSMRIVAIVVDEDPSRAAEIGRASCRERG